MRNVSLVARAFQLQKYFSGCFKSQITFLTLSQYSGDPTASNIKFFLLVDRVPLRAFHVKVKVIVGLKVLD